MINIKKNSNFSVKDILGIKYTNYGGLLKHISINFMGKWQKEDVGIKLQSIMYVV
jgi:hypothetical protein